MAQDENIGKIGWIDMTVEDASGLRDFYAQVVGWEPEAVRMGDYSDFTMKATGDGQAVAGICHAKGENAGMPSSWLIYIVVEDVDRSAALCVENGGRLLVEPKSMGSDKICVIEDPGGAVAALYQSG